MSGGTVCVARGGEMGCEYLAFLNLSHPSAASHIQMAQGVTRAIVIGVVHRGACQVTIVPSLLVSLPWGDRSQAYI